MIKNIIEIAVEAGNLIRKGFGNEVNIGFKTGQNDLVTEIDKASESLIVNYVRKNFPAHGILAEEGNNINTNAEIVWVIDPLDGTTNFAHSLPIFAVSIGVQKNGETIAGVVNDVMNNIIYSAEKKSGSFADDKKISVSSRISLNQSLLVTGFPYDIKENPENTFERFELLTKSSRGMRRLGSAAIDFCYVAKGVFDGFWEVHLHPWDICAGKLIVEEAGGLVTDFKGNPINIYSKKILASNGKIHNEMITLMNRID